jgi:hypothetical protein
LHVFLTHKHCKRGETESDYIPEKGRPFKANPI